VPVNPAEVERVRRALHDAIRRHAEAVRAHADGVKRAEDERARAVNDEQRRQAGDLQHVQRLERDLDRLIREADTAVTAARVRTTDLLTMPPAALPPSTDLEVRNACSDAARRHDDLTTALNALADARRRWWLFW
jgi:hypothetical protein